MSKRRHNFGTKRFKEKSLFIFHARIALKSLILLFVRLIARGARIGKTHTQTDTQTDRQNEYCNPGAHNPGACAPGLTSTVTLAHARRGLNMKSQLTDMVSNDILTTMFPNLHTTISLSIPVATASVERSFSQMKLIKMRLHSSLKDTSLSHLMKIAIESQTNSQIVILTKYSKCGTEKNTEEFQFN